MTTEYPVSDSLDMNWVVDVAQLPVSEAEPSLHIATIEAESQFPLQYSIASIHGFGNIQVNTIGLLLICLFNCIAFDRISDSAWLAMKLQYHTCCCATSI
jgi:hypothetical protein